MNHPSKFSIMRAAALAFIICSVVGITPSYAESLIVTNTNDNGVGSLRQAILDAAADATITFAPELSGETIHLASELTLTRNVTIDGSALASQIIISGDTTGDGTGDVRVLHVNNSITVTLSNLTITKGDFGVYGGGGGGIFNEGALTVAKSSVSDNYIYAAGSGGGGGIFNKGSLTITDCSFSNNSAHAGDGGGIFNQGILNVKNSTFSNNSTTFSISDSNRGGAIYNTGTLSISNSTFTSNSAYENSPTNGISGVGGGIFSGGGILTITNSTFAGNSAYYGGGVYLAGGALTIRNSSFAGNFAYRGNRGGGGVYLAGGTLNFANTIIADSTLGGDCYKTNGTIVTNSNNLVGDGTCSTGGINFKTGDPKLDYLADNGGPTLTIALLSDSPAVDAGDNTICADAATVNNLDQRGVARPQGAACDIGAYEGSIYAKSITSFTFPVSRYTSIDQNAHTIAVGVPTGTNVTSLVATFTTTGASVTVNGIPQISGVSVNDFTNPVIYTVSAADASTRDYTVTAVDMGCYATVTVTSAADSGPGTLRQAVADVCTDGSIDFAPELSGATIHLASELILSKNTTIDGSSLAAQIIISGDTDGNGIGDVRVFKVNIGVAATLSNLTITKAASADIRNYGLLRISNSTVSDSSAAGIANIGDMTVRNCTFSGNAAAGIGASPRYGNGTDAYTLVINSTFVKNEYGIYITGDIVNQTHVTIKNSTFSGNYSAGVYNFEGNTLRIENTIIANTSDGHDCVGAKPTNSLVEDGSCSGGVNFKSGNPMLLDDLADNGGPTKTIALLPGSPAIDAGDNAICADAATVNNLDQRGIVRPQGPACDLGSYERTLEHVPEMNVMGNNTPIADGDTTPSIADATDFGPVSTSGGIINHTFTIENPGDASLVLGGAPKVTIIGANAADFTVTDQPSSPVIAGHTTTFTVRFDPSAMGPRTATIRIQNNDSNENPYTFTIRGRGSVERVKNGGFNTYPTISRIPTNWDAVNFSSLDGKDILIKKEGPASVKITGAPGKTKKLTQTLAISGAAGLTINFSFWEKDAAIPTADIGVCRVQVLFYQGSTPVMTKIVNCLTGTHSTFRQRIITFKTTSAFSKVVIMLIYSKPSGTVWIDLVSWIK